ncbi:MAG: CvpA family protein [Bacilli bacterium]|nr:CvpA family protein [Bacilli bacterium]
MIIDIVLAIIIVFFILNGLIKGVFENIISIIFIIIYYLISNKLYQFLINYLPYDARFYLQENTFVGYIIIIIIGLILLGIILFLFKHFIKKSFISLFDRLVGVIVGLIIGFLLVCILNSGVNFINNNLPQLLKDNKEVNSSFLLSKEFNQKYNILNGVFFNDK